MPGLVVRSVQLTELLGDFRLTAGGFRKLPFLLGTRPRIRRGLLCGLLGQTGDLLLFALQPSDFGGRLLLPLR